jgi:predicted metal-dependent HD superfamily phosphohydrolase
MITNNEVINRASQFVYDLFRDKLPAWAVYHNYKHTMETVEAVMEIGEASKLSKAELEIAVLAAWFHDAGYVDGFDGHEARGVEIASRFLKEQGYAPERVEQIAGCIRATKMPQSPKNLIEQVMCDADMIHLGKKKFFEKSDLMRLEFERRFERSYTDLEWLNSQIDFVSKHQYHTKYARDEFSKRSSKNLGLLQEQLRNAALTESESIAKLDSKKEKQALKEEKEKKPERGIETMFRVVPKNHLDLSSMADSKANLMISTNSIIISITFGLLVSKLDRNTHLIAPTLILLGVCLTTIVFAILATRPKVTSGTFSKEDIQQKRANLLFFGNFHRMPLEDFQWGMNEMMKDRDYLYNSMVKDLYFLGKVLGVKYRYLRIAYTIFMYGLIVSVIAFGIALLFAPPVAP